MIPENIKLKKNELPDAPGVYFYYDAAGKLLYVGKATSLKKRVGSYFVKAHDNRIAEMVRQIARIDYIQTPTVIEALVLEANQIKALLPKYNILMRDDKSFLYLAITNEPFPRPMLLRGHELMKLGVDPFRPKLTEHAKKKFLRIFGPYTSSQSLKKALDLIRRIIPWSDCQPPERVSPHARGGARGGGSTRARPCFNVHIGKCPGVCSGAVSRAAYRKIIRRLILFFEGNMTRLRAELRRAMQAAAKAQNFEEAALLRNKLNALDHIQDVALISKEDVELPYAETDTVGLIDLDGRIESYDISNISGTSAVGSMVVFVEGKPAKDEYRRFRIKTVRGSNDVAMLEEVIRRRLARAFPPARGGTKGGGSSKARVWALPEIMVIDGGEGQVNRVERVLTELGVSVPVIGIAKGFDRKQDRLVYDRGNLELQRVAERGKPIFQRARDEAHRFAVAYHRKIRDAVSSRKK